MRREAQGYLLKEYGSWSVLLISFLTGVLASRTFSWALLPLVFALGLLVNSKQAFMKWIRKTDHPKARLVFIGQLMAAALILLALFGNDIVRLLPLLIFPAGYLLASKFAGDHSLVTEWSGFALLSLAAVLAKFLLTGGVDVRLFVGVAFYFTPGVFKIKALLLKKMQYRLMIALSVIMSALAYRGMHLSLVILLPLLENLVVAATPYQVRLRTTGWIEVGKSLAFLILFAFYY